jgi:hypothetical protein
MQRIDMTKDGIVSLLASASDHISHFNKTMKSIAAFLLQAAIAASVLLESTVHAAPLVARADSDDVSNPFPATKSIKLPIAQRKWRTARHQLEKRQESASNGTADDIESELLNWQDAR